jgi:hypothetical protein
LRSHHIQLNRHLIPRPAFQGATGSFLLHAAPLLEEEPHVFEILKGKLPNRVLGLVLEWAALSRDELRADWERARKEEPLEPIQPLE